MLSLRTALVVAFAFAAGLAPLHGQGLFRAHHGTAGDRVGVGLAAAGDVDQDGAGDYVVGSPYELTAGGSASGVARVHSGATGAVLWKFAGATHAEFGWSADGGGDVDQDGFPDVLIGSDGFNSLLPNAGRAQVFSGRTGAELLAIDGELANEQFSHDLAFVGDLDLDGSVDFAVGAPRLLSPAGVYPSGVPGKVVAFSGATGAPLHAWIGALGSDAFGVAVAAAGDVDGDGRPDVAVGAWGPAVGTGHAYVYSGADGSTLHALAGTYAGQNFGLAIDGAGDLDGDGRDDFAVGAPGWDAVLLGWPLAGEVMVHSGATGAVLRTLHGSAPRDLFGCELANLGDADGDGGPELAICSSPYDFADGTYGGGSVRVHALATGDLAYAYPVPGISDYDITTFVSAAGDVNGDGLRDLLAGAPAATVGGVDSGRAEVLWLGNAKCGPLAAIGTPCPGGGGSAPLLALTGCPTAGGFITLSILNGPPESSALLVLGLSAIALPIGAGCSWYVGSALPAVLGPLPLGGLGPGQGSFTFTAMIPPGTPPLELAHQAIVLDASAPLGFTTTNAVVESIE